MAVERTSTTTARAIVLHNDCLLLIERWRAGLHYFSIPGGHLEPGETPEQTVVREVTEETSCTVHLERQLYTFRREDGSENLVYLCAYISGEPHLPADSEEAIWGGADNRFEPRWVPLKEVAGLPFLVWKPIRDQLLLDLAAGLPKEPRLLA